VFFNRGGSPKIATVAAKLVGLQRSLAMREVDAETPVVWPAWCYSGIENAQNDNFIVRVSVVFYHFIYIHMSNYANRQIVRQNRS
jgi:hypothetical protein